MIIISILIALAITGIFYKKTVPQLEQKQRIFLAVLRFISIVIVLILLLNPILHITNNIVDKPLIILLHDNSLSMDQVGEEGVKKEILDKISISLTEDLDDSGYELIKHNFATSLDGDKANSLLSPSLNEIMQKYSARNIKAIILFSDGWFRDDDLDIISTINIPIYSFSPEFNQEDFDLTISRLHLNKTTYMDEITPIICDVSAVNYEKSATLELRVDGRKIDAKKVDFSASSYQQIIFEHEFKSTGMKIIEAEVISDSTSEVNESNNIIQSAIQVKNSKAGMLFITDKLNWDGMFIKDAIRQNDKLNFRILLKRDQFYDGKRKIDLKDYFQNTRLLIISNSGNLHLSDNELKLINNFQSNGGGILFIGEVVPELAELYPAVTLNLPATEKSNFQLTDISKQYQTFNFKDRNELNNIPPVSYFYTTAKLEAEVLALFNNAEQTPAVLFFQKNSGTILYFPFIGLYRWQMWDQDGSYQLFIQNIASWLSLTNQNRTHAYTDKIGYYEGETVKIFLQTYDEKLEFINNLNAELTLLDTTFNKVSTKLMITDDEAYTCKLQDLEPGRYKYEITILGSNEKATGNIYVSPFSPEAFDRGFNYPLLSYICSQSGGLLIKDFPQLKSDFPQAENRIFKTVSEIPLYRKWYLIAAFIFAFCLELYLRKRWGLL